MAQVNTCLKRTFTVFNIFFAIIGLFIIMLTLLVQFLTSTNGGNMEGRTFSLVILYVVGSITLVVAFLGAYGAHKESRVCLSLFLVCMVIGSLSMLRVGIPTAIARPQVERVLREKFNQYLPLDKASDEVKHLADSVQSQLHCCGMFSYEDWEGDIPESCMCNVVEQEEEGVCQTVGYQNLFLMQDRSIYSKPCFPIIIHYVLLVVDVTLGIFFTLAGLALLGMILSSIIIHQMRYPTQPTVVLTVPTIFTSSPPKYQELHNPPPPYC